MHTPIKRRTFLALPLCSLAVVTATPLGCSAPAQALDFSLPKLEDLRPKWGSVGMGATEAEATQRMGSPSSRTETQTMGLAHITLEWKDIKGFRYTARFLGGRLYAKEMTDTR